MSLESAEEDMPCAFLAALPTESGGTTRQRIDVQACEVTLQIVDSGTFSGEPAHNIARDIKTTGESASGSVGVTLRVCVCVRRNSALVGPSRAASD